MNFFKTKILVHKKLGIVACLLILAGGYYWYSHSAGSAAAMRYITAKVEKGTIISSLSDSGQVSALQQLDIKPLVAGQVTSVKVKSGDLVNAGQVLLTLDQRAANVDLLQAKASLTTAQANYQEVISPAESDLNDYRNAVKTAELDLEKSKLDTASSLVNAQATVDSAYSNLQLAIGGESSQIVTNAYRNAIAFLQTTLTKVDDALTQADNILGIDNTFANDSFEAYLSILDSGKLNNAKTSYLVAKQGKVDMHALVDNLNDNTSHTSVEQGLILAENTIFKMSKLFTDLTAVMDATAPVGGLTQSSLDSLKSKVISSRSAMASQYSSVISEEDTLNDAKNSYTTYKNAYDKAVRDLAITKIDIESTLHTKEVALQQAEDNLNKAENPLAKDVATVKAQLESAQAQYAEAVKNFDSTIVKAPFAGQVASVAVKVGEEVSAATAVVTVITQQKVAEITLNEVDVAKVKIGQKVNLTFDAIEDLSITGNVAEIDTIGAVSQGVVSYGVSIVFDVQDDRVKPGMSVNASIILDSKTDVLTVPSSAVKTQTNNSYVQILVNGVPENKIVVVGLSSDTMTEITSGLTEGEEVIKQTVSINSTASQSSNSTQQRNNLRVPGMF